MNEYIVIDSNIGQCVEFILWDGVSDNGVEQPYVTQLRDGSIDVGDKVVFDGNVWIKVQSN